ncbi:MAG TPA: ribonuclease E, partial [Alphaproteobacteria bacterium]|nr:ribonuclease E [Alphaproteobacteria bacterium]
MRELRVDRTATHLRAAVVEDGRLTDLMVDRLDRPSRLGAIHLGRVGRLMPELNAAFVDLGDGTDGYLAAGDVPGGGDVGRALASGRSVVVQVKAEAAAGKAATLTAQPSLTGRLVVHLPAGRGVQVSKRLAEPG